MPTPEHEVPSGTADDPASSPPAGQPQVHFVDAATRVSTPSAFDTWYYGIEDKLGQGTIGMGVCLIVFLITLLVATMCTPI